MSPSSFRVVAVGWCDELGALPAAGEAAEAARLLSDRPGDAVLLLCGSASEAAARRFASETGSAVLALHGEDLDPASGEDAVLALASCLRDLDPAYVVLAHDTRGADLAPALAVRLEAACVTAVEEFAVRDGRRTFLRSVCRGRMRVELATDTPCTVVTVLPGAAGVSVEDGAGCGPPPAGGLPVCRALPGRGRIRVRGRKEGLDEGVELEEADVIVSAGRGIGHEENLEVIRRVAGLFRSAALGASRPVCDQGWLAYRHQVGLTGRTVSPDLYLACGISGASQHVAGMKGSRCIVAINRDPAAPIFRTAHYGIVEDITVFLPLLIAAAKR